MVDNSSPKKLNPLDAESEQFTLADMRLELSLIHERQSQLANENTLLHAAVTKLGESNAQLQESNAQLQECNARLQDCNSNLLLENARLTSELSAAKSRIAVLEDSLSRAWRDIPRSEKGSSGKPGDGNSRGGSASGGGGDGGGSDGPMSYKALYFKLISISDPRLNWHILAARVKKSPQDFWASIGSASELIPPVEDLMAKGNAKEIDSEKSLRYTPEERQKMFKKTKGIHSSFDDSTRYDVSLRVEKMTVYHETLRDESQMGIDDRCLSFRKTCNSFLPNSQVTIGTLLFMIKLHNELKIPLRRIERLLPQNYFSAENIGRWISWAAEQFLPIYLHLADLLKLAKYLRTDDTNTFVLQLIKEAKNATHKADVELSAEEWDKFFNENSAKAKKQRRPDLKTPVTKRLGRVAQYANGKGGKIKVNLTLLAGKSDESDWCSMICFYRTHCGQAGNLISRIFSPITIPDLKQESADNPIEKSQETSEIIEIFVQCDCSDQNNIEEGLRGKIRVIYVGCSDHARRPFKRYASEDENLAYYCLIQFFEIYRIEREIKCGALTAERILNIRSRAWEFWNKLLDVSKIVTAGQCSIIVKNRVHASSSNLFKACQYICNHFDKLTLYISHPQLSQTNGYSERKLRVEKLFVNSSKFSFSELGSVTKDILQTMIATAIGAGTTPEEYFGWVLSHSKEEITSNPHLYTPLAFVKNKDVESQKINRKNNEQNSVSVH